MSISEVSFFSSFQFENYELFEVTGYFHVKYPDCKTIDGRYSSLMKKVTGKWYHYTDHSD